MQIHKVGGGPNEPDPGRALLARVGLFWPGPANVHPSPRRQKYSVNAGDAPNGMLSVPDGLPLSRVATTYQLLFFQSRECAAQVALIDACSLHEFASWVVALACSVIRFHDEKVEHL